MKKYIVFSLPSVLKMDTASFLESISVSPRDFAKWKDDFDDLDDAEEAAVKTLLTDRSMRSVFYAFAVPFWARGFKEIDDDSSEEEFLSYRHAQMKDLMLLISEDGFSLSDMREGIELSGIYDFSEWQQVDEMLTQCERVAAGNIDTYIAKWLSFVPKN